MKLHELTKSKWFKDKSRRKGRGNASKWNTCGKWNKGQKARTGGSIPVFFEWGQTPLVMRIPKLKGFKRYYKFVDDYAVINLARLEADTRITKEVNRSVLVELGYAKKKDKIKILWQGELTKKLTFVDIDSFSSSAKEKIEKAWWTIKNTSDKSVKKISSSASKDTKEETNA